MTLLRCETSRVAMHHNKPEQRTTRRCHVPFSLLYFVIGEPHCSEEAVQCRNSVGGDRLRKGNSLCPSAPSLNDGAMSVFRGNSMLRHNAVHCGLDLGPDLRHKLRTPIVALFTGDVWNQLVSYGGRYQGGNLLTPQLR